MTEFTFITANDIHISDTGPRSRTDDFKESILSKIAQIRMASNKLNSDGTIIAGDLFNLKTPSRNSHNLNQELIREFKKFKSPIYMIEGNHDLTANRLESLNEQPLGVLFADGTLIQLRDSVIEKDSIKISLVGLPYQENIDINSVKLPDKKDCILQICALHLYASPTPGMLFKERIYGYKELSALGSDIFVIGHYHIDQGIEELDGKHFINLGSVSRGTISDEDIGHSPKIGLIKISIDGGKISRNVQALKLKVKPAEEIFDLQKKEDEKKEAVAIDSFVNKLIEDSSSSLKEKDHESVLKNLDVALDVREKVLYFLKEAKIRK